MAGLKRNSGRLQLTETDYIDTGFRESVICAGGFVISFDDFGFYNDESGRTVDLYKNGKFVATITSQPIVEALLSIHGLFDAMSTSSWG
jgi:hypothetical protein